MIIRILAYTDKGNRIAELMKEGLSEHIVQIYDRKSGDSEGESAWIGEAFSCRMPLIFVGAAGIAVRKIAPFVTDKLTDSPVVVSDEHGKHIIPILSGHMGGADALAIDIAKVTGGEAIITTATDLNDTFAVDVWAKNNGLSILNRDGIVRVSSKLLKEGRISVCISDDISVDGGEAPTCIDIVSYPPKSLVDVLVSTEDDCMNMYKANLYLKPKTLCVGMGCKKDTDMEKLEELFCEYVENPTEVYGIASIDLKSREYGLIKMAQKRGIRSYFPKAEELMQVEGDFSESDFVKEVTGVSNVCERAAAYLAGTGSVIRVHKTAREGVTIAVAEKRPKINSWECR